MINSIEAKELEQFFDSVKMKYGYDFKNYKHNTLQRRIALHAMSLNIKTFFEYEERVLEEENIFKEMFKYFSINVTEFFREPEELNILKSKIFPYLSSYSHIKIWDAGCSYGMTSYSMAIILDEMGLLDKTRIYATDFNSKVLKEAKKATYSLEKLEVAKKNYELFKGESSFEKYIDVRGSEFSIKPYIKDRVLFFKHNLSLDKCMNEFQLIVCKNVLIYFDDKLKTRVIKLFDDSLCVNGFLNIGKNEYINNLLLDNFNEYGLSKKVFQKCR